MPSLLSCMTGSVSRKGSYLRSLSNLLNSLEASPPPPPSFPLLAGIVVRPDLALHRSISGFECGVAVKQHGFFLTAEAACFKLKTVLPAEHEAGNSFKMHRQTEIKNERESAYRASYSTHDVRWRACLIKGTRVVILLFFQTRRDPGEISGATRQP